MALAARGNRACALSALRNAIHLDGSRRDSHVALGNLLFDTGLLDEAWRCFDAAAGCDFNYDPPQSNL